MYNKAKIGLLLFICYSLPVAAGNPEVGGGIYAKHCIKCHGGNGRAVLPGTPDLVVSKLMTKTNDQLTLAIKQGGGVMPGYQGLLTQQQLSDLVSYLRTFY